jgi:hypothetical protein
MQLGWHFSGTHSFYALIRDQICHCQRNQAE